MLQELVKPDAMKWSVTSAISEAAFSPHEALRENELKTTLKGMVQSLEHHSISVREMPEGYYGFQMGFDARTKTYRFVFASDREGSTKEVVVPLASARAKAFTELLSAYAEMRGEEQGSTTRYVRNKVRLDRRQICDLGSMALKASFEAQGVKIDHNMAKTLFRVMATEQRCIEHVQAVGF